MHPSDGLRGTRGHGLAGKRVVLAITGSIAAVECFELGRELIRQGAQVHAVLTKDAEKLVTPMSLEFATGNPVITEIDGKVQHVQLLGDVPDKADLLLIAPCTANTISKIACGIDDTTVTTMATIALGSKVPVLIAPAMHGAMYQNPMVIENVEKLKRAGVGFIGPRWEGKKAKIAPIDEIVASAIRRVGKNDYAGKSILVIGGASEEAIDDMRVITNRSTGETAVALAEVAFERGAVVELWMGRSSVPIPSYLPVRRFRTVADVLEMVKDISHDIVLMPAALSDFSPQAAKGKIPSGKKELNLKLRPVPKVLEAVRKRNTKLVAFKAESGVSEQELIEKATARLQSVPLDMIVANDLHNVKPGESKVIMLTAKGKTKACGPKREIAESILDEALKVL